MPEAANGRAVLEALKSLPRVVDAVVCEQHALVTFRPDAPPEGVDRAIERALAAKSPAGAGREHAVRIRYDGPDLDEMVRTTGMSREELAAAHLRPVYVVAAIGFLPGFAYLRGLDPRLILGRRASPRPQVAPLSVGVAGPYTGIYPFASPGGWNLMGTAVDFAPFHAQSGATLALGDCVRFVREPLR